MFKLERCRGYSWGPGELGKGRQRQGQQQDMPVVLPLGSVPCTCVGQMHSDGYVGAEAHIHPDAILRGTRGKERSNLIQKRLTTMALIRKFKPSYPPWGWVQVQDSIGWRRDIGFILLHNWVWTFEISVTNILNGNCFLLISGCFWLHFLYSNPVPLYWPHHFLLPGNSWLSSLSKSESSSANSIYLLEWDPLDMYVFGFSEVPVTYVHRFMWDTWVPSKNTWSRKHKRGSRVLALIPEVEEHTRIQLWKF